jgi:hypothetical protein
VDVVDGAALMTECAMESAGFRDILFQVVADVAEQGSCLAMPVRLLGSNGTVNRLKVQGGGSEKRSFSRTAHWATPETYEAADSGTNNWFDESRFSFFHPGGLPELQSHLHDACIFKGNQLKSVGCSVAPGTPRGVA